MEEILYYSSLFDYYKNLLTPTQQKYFEDYYYNNYSLSEIAENNNISRTAVSKTLKEVKEKLDYYEKSLSLLDNKNKISNLLSKEDLERIERYI